MTLDLESSLAAARGGDTAALDDLCTELYPTVQRFVHLALARDIRPRRPWMQALFSTGDLVQEVFIGVLRDLGGIRGRSRPELLRYIATLTKNRIVDAIRFYEASRRDGRRVETPGADGAHPAPVDVVAENRAGPCETMVTQEQILAFHRALNSFSERTRTLLRERIEHRTPFEKLASTLGYASRNAACKAFHLAQAKLLMELSKV